MALANFDEATLAGKNEAFATATNDLRQSFGMDFVTIGLTAFLGAPLKWVYSAGSTGRRHERIVLAPGHGIGGIVLKAGKPMICENIERDMDPREYSSYPIVFAEDLHSFFALPLSSNGRVVAVLLCAFRTPQPDLFSACQQMVAQLNGELCGLDILFDSAIDPEGMFHIKRETENDLFLGTSQASRVVSAQEEERRRIARELHDGVGQELLALSFSLARLEQASSLDQVAESVAEARGIIEGLNSQIHNISVDLRPSTLDHFGLAPALRSTFAVYQERYGVDIAFEAPQELDRFDRAYETQAYRIIQEAVLNSCKYSGSDRVEVTLEQRAGWLNAAVSDEGAGFDTQHPTIRGSGCGLNNMRERAAIAGGTLNITSNETGTTVELIMPLIGLNSEKQN